MPFCAFGAKRHGTGKNIFNYPASGALTSTPTRISNCMTLARKMYCICGIAVAVFLISVDRRENRVLFVFNLLREANLTCTSWYVLTD